MPNPRSHRLSPMSPFKNFIILAFIFRSLIHIELVYKWCEVGVDIPSFTCGYSDVLVPFVKKLLFSTQWSCHPCQKQVSINHNVLLNTYVTFQSHQPIFHFKIINTLLSQFSGLIKTISRILLWGS